MVKTKQPLHIGLILLSLIILSGCQSHLLQTVESGELLLDENDPSYTFSRNQESSVDIQAPEYIKESIYDIGIRFLDQAYLRNEYDMDRVMNLYQKGLYGYAPYDYISTSHLHLADREALLGEINAIFDSVAELSGFYADNPTIHRRREAKRGHSGLITNKLGTELIFVDEKGLVVSEVFQYMFLGIIALDQIMNVHLDMSVIENEQLIRDHENHRLIKGQNYTELEHHWDLAYGYYKFFWRELVKGDGLPALRGCLREIDLAFTLGRIDINYHLYSELPKYVEQIKGVLSKVILIRTKEFLLGGNTVSNLNEEMPFAFPQLSRGYALLYATTFITDAKGQPCFTYQEVKEMQRLLLGENGFWDRERLLTGIERGGVLHQINNMLEERLKTTQY